MGWDLCTKFMSHSDWDQWCEKMLYQTLQWCWILRSSPLNNDISVGKTSTATGRRLARNLPTIWTFFPSEDVVDETQVQHIFWIFLEWVVGNEVNIHLQMEVFKGQNRSRLPCLILRADSVLVHLCRGPQLSVLPYDALCLVLRMCFAVRLRNHAVDA